MDICSKISSFFHACLATNTSAVIVRNSDMDKSIHNDEFLSEHNLCNSCERNNDNDIDLSEKLEEIIQILEEVKNDDDEDENVFYDEAYEDKEKENNSGKFSLI